MQLCCGKRAKRSENRYSHYESSEPIIDGALDTRGGRSRTNRSEREVSTTSNMPFNTSSSQMIMPEVSGTSGHHIEPIPHAGRLQSRVDDGNPLRSDHCEGLSSSARSQETSKIGERNRKRHSSAERPDATKNTVKRTGASSDLDIENSKEGRGGCLSVKMLKQNIIGSILPVSERRRSASECGRKSDPPLGHDNQHRDRLNPSQRSKLQKNRYEGQVSELKKLVQTHEQTIDGLKERLKIDQQNRHHLYVELDNTQFPLEEQASDSSIYLKFEVFPARLSSWAGMLVDDDQPAEFDEDHLAIYFKVAPNCHSRQDLENLVKDPRIKELFVQGLVARVMFDKIIRMQPCPEQHPSESLNVVDLWLDEVAAEGLFELERQLFSADSKVALTRAYNDWRALTAHLLMKTRPESPSVAIVHAAVKEVMRLVGPWTLVHRHEELEKSLHALFTNAVDFSRWLRTQRPSWHVHFPHVPRAQDPGSQISNLMFDPVQMRDEDQNDFHRDEMNNKTPLDPEMLRQNSVRLILHPALYRSGTHTGVDFDKDLLRVPALVLMSSQDQEW